MPACTGSRRFDLNSSQIATPRRVLRAVITQRGGGRLLCSLWLLVALNASSAFPRDLDGDKLRSLAQTEKDAGNVVAFYLVETYHAMGITTAHPHVQGARNWADLFCDRASRDFKWEKEWTLVVYDRHQKQLAHACRIPTTLDQRNAR